MPPSRRDQRPAALADLQPLEQLPLLLGGHAAEVGALHRLAMGQDSNVPRHALGRFQAFPSDYPHADSRLLALAHCVRDLLPHSPSQIRTREPADPRIPAAFIVRIERG